MIVEGGSAAYPIKEGEIDCIHGHMDIGEVVRRSAGVSPPKISAYIPISRYIVSCMEARSRSSLFTHGENMDTLSISLKTF